MPQVEPEFYMGLVNNSKEEKVRLFEESLTSYNIYIRHAAVDELAKLMYEGVELSEETAEKVRREAAGIWAAAFDDDGKMIDKEKALEFLLEIENETFFDEVRFYVLRECEKSKISFDETELAAIQGHYLAVKDRYNEALKSFRRFMKKQEWPAQLPALFLRYPQLINDLGKAFQYTGSGNEGIGLFLKWGKNLENTAAALAVDMPDGAPVIDAPDTVAAPVDAVDLRYRLQFFAARIARRRGQVDLAVSLFQQARLIAPADKQSDACIWYILDLSLSGPSSVFMQRLEQLIPFWHEDGYFENIIEKYLRELTFKKEWKNLIKIFSLLKDRNYNVSKIQCAWIIARAVEEGYLNAEDKQLAAETADVSTENLSADVFMRIAHDAADRFVTQALYYRFLSAAALGKQFLPETEDKPVENGASSSVIQFLLGFFKNNAADFSIKYINLLEKELNIYELRTLAQALEQEGMFIQSMRLVSLYIDNDGYIPQKQDMELLFPRPYKELIEKYAAEYGIAPALLFGLIRTESAFQNGSVSSAGAVGLTQLMPDTAKDMANRIRRSSGTNYTVAGEIDLKDPAINIHIGSYYLNYLMKQFDDTLLSLLAYNGGMNRVRQWHAGNKLPVDLFLETAAFSETREYGRKVIGAAAMYKELYY